MCLFFFCSIRRPPIYTRTATLFSYAALFRSPLVMSTPCPVPRLSFHRSACERSEVTFLDHGGQKERHRVGADDHGQMHAVLQLVVCDPYSRQYFDVKLRSEEHTLNSSH